MRIPTCIKVLHYPAASVLSSTRLQCIHDISMILEPVIGVPTKHLHENNERYETRSGVRAFLAYMVCGQGFCLA